MFLCPENCSPVNCLNAIGIRLVVSESRVFIFTDSVVHGVSRLPRLTTVGNSEPVAEIMRITGLFQLSQVISTVIPVEILVIGVANPRD